MDKLAEVFIQHNYMLTHETTKGLEFENKRTGEVIYLLPNVETTIVLNPKTIEGNAVLKEKVIGLSHSTALKQFSKRKHTGKDPIHYGYSIKFQSPEELGSFLADLK